MAFMEWKETYSVNVQEIDGEHQKLIGMINELHDAMKVGKGKTIITIILRGMINYATTHFATEEKYMRVFDFPGYAEHKAEHDAFTNKVIDFQRQYNRGSTMLTFDVMDFLNHWLVTHIQGTDKKYGPFFNMKGLM